MLPFVFRGTRVAAVTVALGDSPVPVMNNQLGTLIPADFPGVVNGILLPVKVLDGALATTLLDVPSAAASTWNDMMSLS